MAKYRLIFSDEARMDIAESVAFFDLQQQDLSDRFLADLESVLHKLERQAERYSFYRSSIYRSVSLDVFAFQIIYQIIADELIIVSVRHTARRPFTD